jgi:hypothetical protein
MASVGVMSTAWPWPYPPVELAYPEFQQYRADPSNTQDGMGTAYVSLDDKGGAFARYQPFADSLQPAIKNGFKV